jgi:hypothetical protein
MALQSILRVSLPDNASPSDEGVQDQRHLGIALMRMRLIRLSYTSDLVIQPGLQQSSWKAIINPK